jgi:curli production assembly/transport component CsgF
MIKRIALFSFLLASCSGAAFAQDLVYEPVNPSFGGNAFNSAHLLAIANAQNDYDPPEQETSSQDDLDRFVRSLQSRLLSSLSTQVANAIFGEDAQDEGTIVFGDQTITFVRTLDGIVLTITNADGSTTVITVPIFQSSTDSDEDGDESGKNSDFMPEQGKYTDLQLAEYLQGTAEGNFMSREPLLSQTADTPIQ